MRAAVAICLMAALFGGCGSTTPSAPAPEPEPEAGVMRCVVSVFGLPSGELMTDKEPIPPGSQLVAGPRDFDPSGAAVETAADGAVTLTLRLRGDAVRKFATYTAAHVGDLLAIVINGRTVSVPLIASSIDDGEIAIRGDSLDQTFEPRVAACVASN